jgi:hypothetical protein
MRKDHIAEWLLVQVTSRERAASTVGDMMETAATRGTVWFWTNVFRATASLMWRGFAADPANMLSLAFRGWLMSWLFMLVLMLCIVVGSGLFGVAYGMLAATRSTSVGAVSGGLVQWPFQVFGFSAVMLCQFQVGRWIARRAPGRELSACLALAIMQEILGIVVTLGLELALGHSLSLDNWGPGLLSLWMVLPCFAGALWVRRRAVR